MKLVVFGLSISSSWGNAHATVWRGLCTALAKLGVHVVFFEKDMPYYAKHRDLTSLPNGELCLYEEFPEVVTRARWHLVDADAAIVTSFCPDALNAAKLVLRAQRPIKVFYDLDAAHTLSALERDEPLPYISHEGLSDFDVLLSTTGGMALRELGKRLGIARQYPLYRAVDVDAFAPVDASARFRSDLSYLGNYSAEQHARLLNLLVKPAALAPEKRFVVAGSLYPANFAWPDNVRLLRHLPSELVASVYASSRLTLSMLPTSAARLGYGPPAGLFEAAAVGVPIISEAWEGLDYFFTPGREVLVARRSDDVLNALSRSDGELLRMARAARERVLSEHTAYDRARELLDILTMLKRGLGPRAEDKPA